MVAYEKRANDLVDDGIQYVEMRFDVRDAHAHRVECGTQTYELAHLRTRITAAVIDLAILAAATTFFNSLFGSVGLLISVAFLFAFQWYFLSERFGQTPGKMVMNIFVVRADGEFLTSRDALLRTLGYMVNLLFLGFGWLWIIGDRKEQGWHDKLAHTYVVKS